MNTNSKIPTHPLKTLASIAALFTATFSLGLLGCVTPTVANKTISIDSDPVGVRVEVNGEYLGKTPTVYTVRPNEHGDFKGGWGDSPSVVFVAFPPEGVEGLYKQTKVFNPSGFMDKGDRVPARILFDLHRAPGQ